jgi:uncharacterized protein YkwD
MNRRAGIALFLVAFLSACVGGTPPQLGPDGLPLPKLYKIGPGDVSRVTFSMVDAVNELRRAAGAAPVTLNSQLTAAAATHSRDMSIQNRPWHFGSDGSSPVVRVQRTGYPGVMLGENISETFEDEVTTLTAWMEKPDTRTVILDPVARNVGFSWYQEPTGKIWWTLITGS